MQQLNSSGNTLDLSALRYVQARLTELPTVWTISMPAQPWKFKRAEQERLLIVRKLGSAAPFRALWRSNWTSETRSGWSLATDSESELSTDEELSNGAWALFFFRNDPASTLESLVPTVPASAADALQAIHDCGAIAAIWSWYDDREWTIATDDAQ